MIHIPQTKKELIGRTETVAKLYQAWNDITQLYVTTLKIHKDDWGMDRTREMMIHRAREKLPEIRTLIEHVIELFKKDIEAMF